MKIVAIVGYRIDTAIGGGVRGFYTLKILQKAFNAEIIIYTLTDQKNERLLDNHILDIWIPYSSISKVLALKGYGYILWPSLLRYHEELAIKCKEYDVVVFGSMYDAYCLLKNFRFDNRLLIYNAHDVEYYYWLMQHKRFPLRRYVSEKVREAEGFIIDKVDCVLVTSNEDKERFIKLYNVNRDKIIVLPNSINTEIIKPVDEYNKQKMKKEEGLNDPIVVFMGSDILHANREAALFINEQLAPKMQDITFIIIGSVGNVIAKPSKNVRCTGKVSDDKKVKLLQIADIAINPVLEGTGTSVKMIEYMAAGLPIVTTRIGARGLDLRDNIDAIICERDIFKDVIYNLLSDQILRSRLSHNARERAKEYDYKYIANNIKTRLMHIMNNE